MKPYGREKKVTGGQSWKKDYHPRKGYRNWWEDICDFLSRSSMKQRIRKEIENEINENKEFCNMGQKNKISNNITNLIKEFTKKHCSNCKLYDFCGGEIVLICKEFNKFLEEHD